MYPYLYYRMYQNDIENLVPFFTLGLLYSFTSPELFEARAVFGFFSVFRLAHTLSMVGFQAQPSRFHCCVAAWLANAFMAYKVFRAYVF